MATVWKHSTPTVGDLISPYGDFDEDSDVSSFWGTSLSSITTENVSSASVVSGALKIVSTTSSDESFYIKAIPVSPGLSYTIAGSSISAADSSYILGGSTSKGNEYFAISVGTAGLPDTFAEDLVVGALTFTVTTDTLYLTFKMDDPSDYLSIDDISLTGLKPFVEPTAGFNFGQYGDWNAQTSTSWEGLSTLNWENWNRLE
jgi:hypothetical protein